MQHLVLVVEDDPSLRLGLTRLIEGQGHAVLTAATIREGMHHLGSNPTHLLLDMNLPDGTGTSILRHVKEAGLAIRVAFLTASRDRLLLDEAESLRPDEIFTKPADWDAVLDWIVI